MLTLKKLQLQNIGRFTESQEIDFTQVGSLVQVEGDNRNTSGSSGAGKSTIFKSLEFLLGINDLSNSVLQSRLTKSPMSVTGLFDLDGIPLKIERGKKLLIELNGVETTGSSKLSEEKLDEIIGMPRDLFRKILHKRQGEGGFFLDMGPSEVHSFLTSCLGLEREQAKIVVLDTKLKYLSDKEISLKSATESHKSALEATKSAISSLGPLPILNIAPESIVELEKKYLGVVDTHNLVKESHKRELQDLEASRPQITTAPFDRSRIEQLENEIVLILSQINELEKVETNRQFKVKSQISELQNQVKDLQNSEVKRQSEVKNKISTIRTEIQKLQQNEKDRQALIQSKISNNKIEQIKAKSVVDAGERAKTEAAKLVEELKKIRASLCPTCEQNWVNDAAKAKEADILQKLSEYKKSVLSGIEVQKRVIALDNENEQLKIELQPKSIPGVETLIDEYKRLELEAQPQIIPELDNIKLLIDQLLLESSPQAVPEAIELKLKKDLKSQELLTIRQQEKEHQNKENIRNQDILSIFAQKQNNLRQTHEGMIKIIRDDESRALSEFETAKNKVKSFEESKKRFGDSLAKLDLQLSSYDLQLSASKVELAKVQEEIELAQESKKAIKSYLSCSFEDALDGIGDGATRMVRSVSNMSTATIQFEGLKETKEGKIKEEVTCLISMDGEIGVPVKSLSGGERSSVDLAIDLAVIKFIEERTGKGIDLFILDEPFTGLDSQCCEDAIEMLKNSNADKRIFLVDHNPQVAQVIENKITVIRDGQTSRIVQQ